jgi:hypothetical protein
MINAVDQAAASCEPTHRRFQENPVQKLKFREWYTSQRLYKAATFDSGQGNYVLFALLQNDVARHGY